MLFFFKIGKQKASFVAWSQTTWINWIQTVQAVVDEAWKQRDQKRRSFLFWTSTGTVLKRVALFFLFLSIFRSLSLSFLLSPSSQRFHIFALPSSPQQHTKDEYVYRDSKGERPEGEEPPGVAIYSEFRNDQCFRTRRHLPHLLLHRLLFLHFFALLFFVFFYLDSLFALIDKEWEGREEPGAILSYSYFATPVRYPSFRRVVPYA